MRNKYFLAISMLSVFFLIGCVHMEVDLKSDGSGTIKYSIQESPYVTASDVKKEFNKEIDSINSTGKEVVKLKSFKSKGNQIEAVVSFTDISLADDNFLLATVNDIKRYEPNLISDVKDVSSETKVDLTELEKVNHLAVLHISGIDSEVDLVVNIPGKIKYLSGASIAKGNTIDVQSRSAVIIYEPKSQSFLLPLFLFILVAGIGYWLYRTKFKHLIAQNVGLNKGKEEDFKEENEIA